METSTTVLELEHLDTLTSVEKRWRGTRERAVSKLKDKAGARFVRSRA